MRILILGGYGLIGLGIARQLAARGHEVIGLGRSREKGERLYPAIRWIGVDLARMTRPDEWTAHLAGVDAVVNAAGALQDGARDDLAAVQDQAIQSLIAACEAAGTKRFIQISAPGAASGSSTAFYRTKAAADARLKASGPLDWLILRPGLVIAPAAYGGTALLRLLAAVPLIQPLVHAERKIQTLALSDLTELVADAIEGKLAPGQDLDVAEDTPHSLAEVVAAFRRWLGFTPARRTVLLPGWCAGLVSRGADLLGHLGWRSPLRSTALTVMSEDVLADPAPLEAATGRRLSSLEETLAGLPSTLQERWFARMALMMPVVIAVLSLFWIASGTIGFIRFADAQRLLLEAGLPPLVSTLAVAGGAIADILLGLMILIRSRARQAALGMILLSLAYLASASLVVPGLWLDPLGPLVKVLPSIPLALVAIALLEER
ncbi:SDR family oxidoreductase [Stappia taiwanensis]|uniref:SDR family oxidoreductase n=1 Tax=Stappia taiwanensis TaxID=992267 RepID=A0A838XVY0_9HYPH|nr:SDR family oxidoreductase [Stappia taiwanensis]MBA4611113.1 SDR family oxidoreductase [Stappia taiwanensis]GGE86043.1 hypothetical protein GCM10007285_12060 [Stappia taiwanensis]